MSVLKPTLFSNDTIKMNRTTEVCTSFFQERPKKLLSSHQFRRATLSPLHLPHKSSDDVNLSTMSLTIRSTHATSPAEKVKACVKVNQFEDKIKEKQEDSDEIKRFQIKISRIGPSLEHSVRSEKIKILDNSWKLNSKGMINGNMYRSSLPARIPRKKLKALNKEVKLKVSGIMKLFSPRNATNGLEPLMTNFK